MSEQLSMFGESVEVRGKHHQEELAVFRAALGDLDWGDGFVALCEQLGFKNWRKAALIAWLAVPEGLRVPADRAGLAALLGLSSAQRLNVWARQPSTQALLVDFSATETLMNRLADVDKSLVEEATKPGMAGYQHKKLFYQRLGIANDAPAVVVNTGELGAAQVKGLSDAELLAAVEDDLGAIEGEWEVVGEEDEGGEENGEQVTVNSEQVTGEDEV